MQEKTSLSGKDTHMSRTSFALPEALHTYLLAVGTRPDAVRLGLREATNALPNSGMQISTEQGEFMDMLIKLMGATKCLEVGTFTGYSALVTAQALPETGRLICCDVSDEYTAIGKPFWAEAGVAHKIDLHIAPATDTLDALLADGQARCPADLSPPPPGSCTECVASKITGKPNDFMIGIERMSATRLL